MSNVPIEGPEDIFLQKRCWISYWGCLWLQIYEYFCVTEKSNGSEFLKETEKGNIFRKKIWKPKLLFDEMNRFTAFPISIDEK